MLMIEHAAIGQGRFAPMHNIVARVQTLVCKMFLPRIGLNSRKPTSLGCWFRMEYPGKEFTIRQGVGPGSWTWTVQLDERAAKSGEAPTRPAAMNSVVWVFDRSLKVKKAKFTG